MKAEELLRLADIIEMNGLSRPEKRYIPHVDNYIVLSKLIEKFDTECKELAFLLIENYDIFVDYRIHALTMLRSISQAHEGKIAIFPILDSGMTKIKSGSVMIYELRSVAHSFKDRFIFFDTPDSAEMLDTKIPKYAVDDFIGTGDQFLTMASDIKKRHRVAIDGAAAIVMMEKGKESIELDGYSAIAEITKRKAISGYLRDKGHDDNELLSRYDKVESALNVDHTYRRGYGNSEALVSMKRTPDNTLPIFWNTGSDGKWPAPFIR